jgi:hypothetical protein
MAAQRNNIRAAQRVINTITIFQYFFEKRFVGIKSSLFFGGGSLPKSKNNCASPGCQSVRRLQL